MNSLYGGRNSSQDQILNFSTTVNERSDSIRSQKSFTSYSSYRSVNSNWLFVPQNVLLNSSPSSIQNSVKNNFPAIPLNEQKISVKDILKGNAISPFIFKYSLGLCDFLDGITENLEFEIKNEVACNEELNGNSKKSLEERDMIEMIKKLLFEVLKLLAIPNHHVEEKKLMSWEKDPDLAPFLSILIRYIQENLHQYDDYNKYTKNIEDLTKTIENQECIDFQEISLLLDSLGKKFKELILNIMLTMLLLETGSNKLESFCKKNDFSIEDFRQHEFIKKIYLHFLDDCSIQSKLLSHYRKHAKQELLRQALEINRSN